MVDIAFFKVTRSIALRTGLLKYRYRTVDNKFIIDNKDLQRVRMTSDEMINGFSGIEKISLEEVQRLKAENNYKMGDDNMAEDTTKPIDIVENIEEETEPEVEYIETGDEPEDDGIIEDEEENKEEN